MLNRIHQRQGKPHGDEHAHWETTMSYISTFAVLATLALTALRALLAVRAAVRS